MLDCRVVIKLNTNNAAFAGDVASEVGGILRPIVEQLVEQLVEQVRGLDDGHGDDVGSFKNVQRVSEKLTRGLRDFNGNTVGSVELISTWKEDE